MYFLPSKFAPQKTSVILYVISVIPVPVSPCSSKVFLEEQLIILPARVIKAEMTKGRDIITQNTDSLQQKKRQTKKEKIGEEKREDTTNGMLRSGR